MNPAVQSVGCNISVSGRIQITDYLRARLSEPLHHFAVSTLYEDRSEACAGIHSDPRAISHDEMIAAELVHPLVVTASDMAQN